ncbi:MAG: hypothetical protein C4523_21280 [Myxococcales bacterium]|nr:MAG: hypothetical protein C4523_21280 [Myxococcales bacterium]
MPYCPRCRSEFRSGFAVCANCEIELVASLDEVEPEMTEEAMGEYLAARDLVTIASADLNRLKPLKNLLCQHGIANIVLEPDGGCCASGGCAPKLELAVAANDIERAAEVLRADFQDLVALNADETTCKDPSAWTVNLEGGEVICPACETRIPAGVAECPQCELYVGVPSEFLAEEK